MATHNLRLGIDFHPETFDRQLALVAEFFSEEFP
jgi:hypothetical protein